MIAEPSLTILLVDDSTVDRALYRHFLGSTAPYTLSRLRQAKKGCTCVEPPSLIA